MITEVSELGSSKVGLISIFLELYSLSRMEEPKLNLVRAANKFPCCREEAAHRKHDISNWTRICVTSEGYHIFSSRGTVALLLPFYIKS